MKKVIKRMLALSFILLFGLVFPSNLRAQEPDSSRITGPEVRNMYSAVLKENRKIIIQTPSGMNRYQAYPVLYLLDGEAFSIMAGGQVRYLSESYKIIPDLIVVGIVNTDRTRDLTPTQSITGADGKPDTVLGKHSGGGERFLQYIREELVPYIESRFRTAPFRILCGHSLGGLMAVSCLVNHPDYFNAYIAISPSLQWDDRVVLRQAAQKAGPKEDKRFLFFSDANEDPAFHQNQLELDSILKRKDLPGLKFQRNFYPGETHISEPVKSFYDGIRFVYPNWHLPYNSSAFKKIMSSRVIKEHFAALSEVYGYKVIPLHDEINQISRFLRNDPARIRDAIDLLRMNALNYPSSPVVMEILGDTWLKAGKKEEALSCYQKALSMEPGDAGIQKKIMNLNR